MPDASGSGKRGAAAGRCVLAAAALVLLAPVKAAGEECAPEPQGEGRVAAAIDGRTVRLEDGRLVRLSGLAPLAGPRGEAARKLLADLAVGRDVSLNGDSDAPDRYGRQRAWAFAAGDSISLQAILVAAGGGVRDHGPGDAGCREQLRDAETTAQRKGLGHWAAPSILKNAETPDDISAEIGQFAVVEGRVRSVRQSAGTHYINFGRRFIEGFAVTVPTRVAVSFDAAGRPLKSFEGRTVRVRGYVMRRGGPRIEALDPDQIELDGADVASVPGKRD